YEINRRFLEAVRARYPGDEGKVQRMSLIAETGERKIRMAHMAIVGSFSVNGVSVLHSRLLREPLFPGFHEVFPGPFGHQTHRITPRRWLRQANPWLSELITSKIGGGWVKNLDELKGLVPHASDADFRRRWREAKRSAKERLVGHVKETLGVDLN